MQESDKLTNKKNYRVSNIKRIISLSFMTVITYMIVGFCLASLQINLGVWCVGILLYHYYIASLETQKTHHLLDEYFQNKPLVTLISGLIISSISMLVYQTKPSLGMFQSIIIGLVAVINSWVMLKLTVQFWGNLKAVIFSTTMVWIGLLLGWVAQYYAT